MIMIQCNNQLAMLHKEKETRLTYQALQRVTIVWDICLTTIYFENGKLYFRADGFDGLTTT